MMNPVMSAATVSKIRAVDRIMAESLLQCVVDVVAGKQSMKAALLGMKLNCCSDGSGSRQCSADQEGEGSVLALQHDKARGLHASTTGAERMNRRVRQANLMPNPNPDPNTKP